MPKSAKKLTLTRKHKGKDSASSASAWSPLSGSVFRALWIATVISNVGTWMQDVGESWLMTSAPWFNPWIASARPWGPNVIAKLPADK